MGYITERQFFGDREANLGKFTQKVTPKTAIVVHNTTGTGSAQNNVDYFKNGSNNTSAHVVIDEDKAIEIVPFKYRAHHAGVWNTWTIGIEIARSGDRETDRYDRAEANAIDYIVTVLIQEGWKPTRERIKFHREALATTCPERIPPNREDAFIKLVADRYAERTNTKPAPKPDPKPEVKPGPVAKSNEDLADEVIAGLWGNDPQRSEKLKKAGYDASAIQRIVNAKLSGTPPAAPIKKGDKVRVLRAVQYNGMPFYKARDRYDVIEVSGDRVVIGVGSAVTAAVNIKDIAKV